MLIRFTLFHFSPFSLFMPDHFISRERAEIDLLDCAAFLAERVKSADGHAEAMGEIVPRYLALGDVDLAAELANAIADPFSRDRLLIQVAQKCAEIDDDEYALQLAESVDDHGLRAQALERLALVKAARSQPEKAAEIATLMEHPDFVFAGIAVNHALTGNEAAAEKVLSEIEFPAARANALQQIAALQLADDKKDQAAETLGAAFIAVSEIEHDEERLRALCDIGNLYNDAGRKDKAIETFDRAKADAELLDNMLRDYFLVNCALGFLYAGSEELSDRTLDLVSDKTQMASALIGISRDHWRKDAQEDALDSLDEAYEILRSQREIETRDSRARNATMSSIAVQFAGFGKFERAVEIAQENPDPAEQYRSLTQIAKIQASHGEDELARLTINSIDEDSVRLFALIGVSDTKTSRDQPDAAIALLDEAAELAETVPQFASRSAVLNEIAARYFKAGQADKARAATHESLNVIAQIRDESSQAATLAAIADLYSTAAVELNDQEREHLARLVRKVDW